MSALIAVICHVVMLCCQMKGLARGASGMCDRLFTCFSHQIYKQHLSISEARRKRGEERRSRVGIRV